MLRRTIVKEGDKVPRLVLELSDGTTFDTGQHSGNYVLFFYPKDDTSGCTREAKDFTELMDSFRQSGASVIGISRDSMEKHRKFIAKYELAVPLASDEDGRVSDAFGTWVEKSMYGRKYMGMERSTFLLSSDGRVVRAWRKVKVPGHAEEVLRAVSELKTEA
jgi:thioredoxin-dependent peroxiredoxin